MLKNLNEPYLFDNNGDINPDLHQPKTIKQKPVKEHPKPDLDTESFKIILSSRNLYTEEMLEKMKKEFNVVEMFLKERLEGKYKKESLDPLRNRIKELLILSVPSKLKRTIANRFFKASLFGEVGHKS